MREKNYDLLRMICCVAVIIIHVSGMFFDTSIDYIKNGGVLNL